MDALKMIAQDSAKKEIPQFDIGDTVRIDVNIREGERHEVFVTIKRRNSRATTSDGATWSIASVEHDD